MKKGNGKRKILVLIIFALLLGFLLFPRKYGYLDGGTTGYRGFMFLYSVENRYEYYIEDNKTFLKTGTVISIFGVELYNNTIVDYDHPIGNKHSSEAESLNQVIESVL